MEKASLAAICLMLTIASAAKADGGIAGKGLSGAAAAQLQTAADLAPERAGDAIDGRASSGAQVGAAAAAGAARPNGLSPSPSATQAKPGAVAEKGPAVPGPNRGGAWSDSLAGEGLGAVLLGGGIAAIVLGGGGGGVIFLGIILALLGCMVMAKAGE